MATDKARQRAHYYKRHIGDYKADAGHLTMLQDGAYTRLLDLAYTLDGRLPGDLKRIQALTRATSRPEREAVSQVLEEFFDLQDGQYRHSRVDRELAAMRKVSLKRQDAAQARWNKESDANALQVDSTSSAIHKPLPTNQEPPTNTHAKSSMGAATLAGTACRLMREAGCMVTNPAHPDLLAALSEGVTPENLAATAREALEAGKGRPFPWAIATARGRRAQSSRRPEGHRRPGQSLPSARPVEPHRYSRPPEPLIDPPGELEKASG